MFKRLAIMRLFYAALCLFFIISTQSVGAAVGVCQGNTVSTTDGGKSTTSSASALSPEQCKLILGGIHRHDLVEKTGGTCGSSSSSAGTTELNGADNIEKAYNFFRQKGLNEIQSAAVVGNFKQESGLDPQIMEIGGRSQDPHDAGENGWGIAQWSPGAKVLDSAKVAKVDGPIYEFGTQLEIVYFEMTHAAPTGFQNVLAGMSKTSLTDATEYFRANYEAGTEGFRQKYAYDIYNQYKDNPVTGGGVSGINASCGSSGSVDCSNSSPTSSTGSLSVTRQKVVCVADGEYKRYKSGELKPGTDFFKYSYGVNEEWCAYFASWVYAQAGYPMGSGKGAIPSVLSIKDLGTKGDKFTYHAVAGYTPIPGDLAIHIYPSGGHHVNIVVSVDSKTVTLIGGNEGNDASGANTSSSVQKSVWPSFSSDSIIGYVSPKD